MTLAAQLEARLLAALPTLPTQKARVQPTADLRFGHYQTNVAMILAKDQRANPRQLAAEIIANLQVDDLSEPPEIAGAGFINFRLRPSALTAAFSTLTSDPHLGVPSPSPQKTIVVDFSSPNVAKPMHIGHIRSTILGDALARIATFIGHRVIRDNHIGDWGTQFGMLLVGWKTELQPDQLAIDPLGEMERLYKLISARCQEHPPTLAAARAELVHLQAGNPENLALWEEMLRLSQNQFSIIYQRLQITFDTTLGESFYNPVLSSTIDSLRSLGIARPTEGALGVFSDGSLPEKEDPFLIQRDGQWIPLPALVQKADGASNYTTTDLATLHHRLQSYSPDSILYVTDGRQQHHFNQLFAIFRRWQPSTPTELAHVWFGTILGPDGRPFKTRSGQTVKLTDLLDEAEERAFTIVTEKNPTLPESERRAIAQIIGIGAVKYADLLPNRQSDYTFSWDKMLALTGNTAPYLQYSCVRIQSIFRKADLQEPSTPLPISLNHPAELALALKLLQFGEVLPQILDDYRPNLLCNYLYELASLFHSFFEACPVLKADPLPRSTRLALCTVADRILRTGLNLLGISVPERM